MQSYKNVDEYISRYPQKTQKILRRIRKLIIKIVPEATETISYGIPTYKLNGNLVHFGGFEKHVSLFPTSEPVEHFKRELVEYKTSKGTIQFSLDKPVPYDLIEEIVKYRVKQQKNVVKVALIGFLNKLSLGF